MPRFYFHVRHGDRFTRDVEGVDLPDLEAVKQEAWEGARAFAASEPDDQQYEVHDEDERTVLIYPFEDAFSPPLRLA